MYRLIRRGEDAPSWPRPEGMPPLIHELLTRRGVRDAAEAEAFLHPAEAPLGDPFALPGLREAAGRIERARQAGARITVFGDYDVDGVCATAILKTWLDEAGVACAAYIPDRHAEGYGLNEAAVRDIAARADLLITVDCGISCLGEVALAKSLGLEVIVTDHHRPGDQLPDCTVVNPLVGEGYPAPLCGAGVALKLVQALGGDEAAMARIDLAALATVADLVPLTGENRRIVAKGLQRINAAPRPGVRLLIEQAGLTGKPVNAGTVAFQLAPRINASGRLGDAARALALLTCADEAEGGPIARELEAENTRRRQETNQILDACLGQMRDYDLMRHRVIVLCGEGWNAGVIGLVASQLTQKYHYPTVLLSEKDGQCVGSCRSIPAVDIFEALKSCADLFTRYGGHRQAAGLAMPRDRVGELIERLDTFIGAHTRPDDFIPEAEYDIGCGLADLTEDAVRMLDLMQPTGYGNPAPVFLTAARVDAARAVGRDGSHLQVRLVQDDTALQGIAWGRGDLAPTLDGASRDMLVSPSLNSWRGNISVQCDIRTFLPERAEGVFARYGEKYARYLRAFLTELLYNRDQTSLPAARVVPADEDALTDWLRASPQGTVIAAATDEGARGLQAFLVGRNLTDRLDVTIGAWPEGPTPMNAACLSPVGPAPVRCARLILWDAPAAAYASLPPHDEICLMRRARGWLERLPDVDTLRQVYLTVRWAAQGGMARAALSDIEREIARLGGFDDAVAVPAALAVLDHMDLIRLDRGAARLTLRPPRKGSPQDDPLYQRLAGIRDA